mgnify:CR=1 FL=1
MCKTCIPLSNYSQSLPTSIQDLHLLFSGDHFLAIYFSRNSLYIRWMAAGNLAQDHGHRHYNVINPCRWRPLLITGTLQRAVGLPKTFAYLWWVPKKYVLVLQRKLHLFSGCLDKVCISQRRKKSSNKWFCTKNDSGSPFFFSSFNDFFITFLKKLILVPIARSATWGTVSVYGHVWILLLFS